MTCALVFDCSGMRGFVPSTFGRIWLAAGTGTAAAQVNTASSAEVVLLAQLATLIVLGRLPGKAMQRLGQPSVMGELLAGILLGPSDDYFG